MEVRRQPDNKISGNKLEKIRGKKYILSDELVHPKTFPEIITESKRMPETFKYIGATAETTLLLLISIGTKIENISYKLYKNVLI